MRRITTALNNIKLQVTDIMVSLSYPDHERSGGGDHRVCGGLEHQVLHYPQDH